METHLTSGIGNHNLCLNTVVEIVTPVYVNGVNEVNTSELISPKSGDVGTSCSSSNLYVTPRRGVLPALDEKKSLIISFNTGLRKLIEKFCERTGEILANLFWYTLIGIIAFNFLDLHLLLQITKTFKELIPFS
jgi:hypothetical protein